MTRDGTLYVAHTLGSKCTQIGGSSPEYLASLILMREINFANAPGDIINQQKDLTNVLLENTTIIQAWQGYRHAVTTTQVNASVTTTNFGSQTYQVRIVHTCAGIWATIDTTATVTAQSSATWLPASLPEYFAVTRGQQLNFISTSTSTGYVVLTEMT